MKYHTGGMADAGIAIIVGLFIGLVAAELVKPTPPAANAQQTTQTCPAGSYDIGISKDGSPICKLEPTGCPYGDSIPLGPDCDKHKPVNPIAEPENIPLTPAQPLEAAQCGGK